MNCKADCLEENSTLRVIVLHVPGLLGAVVHNCLQYLVQSGANGRIIYMTIRCWVKTVTQRELPEGG